MYEICALAVFLSPFPSPQWRRLLACAQPSRLRHQMRVVVMRAGEEVARRTASRTNAQILDMSQF